MAIAIIIACVLLAGVVIGFALGWSVAMTGVEAELQGGEFKIGCRRYYVRAVEHEAEHGK